MLHFIYIFSTNISTEYFKHAAPSPFFSSKCRLFHNATIFYPCIIHILHTGCAKNLNVKLRCQRLTFKTTSLSGGGGRSVGIVRSRTKAMEFSLV
jgi:hypothetical protein